MLNTLAFVNSLTISPVSSIWSSSYWQLCDEMRADSSGS